MWSGWRGHLTNASYTAGTPLGDSVFAISVPQLKFGMGATREVGFEAKRLGMSHVLLVSGRRIAETRMLEDVRSSLENEGIRVNLTTHVRIEPEDEALVDAYREIKSLEIDGFVALGGGSTIDTAKILNLLYSHPAELSEYMNRPVGKGLSPAGSLRPLVAIPTTAGTGSESTAVAVLGVSKLRIKTGVSNPLLRPSVAIIDPLNSVSLPPMVTASSGMDVLNHAIESLTARPYTARPAPKSPADRAIYAGATPVGDLFAGQVVRWVHQYLRRAVRDPQDVEARYYMSLGSSLAGLGFGHAGVHVPHAMAYPIAGMIRRWYPSDYELGYPISPHGISTALPAAYVFRYLTPFKQEAFRQAADCLGLATEGLDVKGLADALFEYYIRLLEDLRIPTTLGELDFSLQDVEALVEGTLAQQRLISLSPKTIEKPDLDTIFRSALG